MKSSFNQNIYKVEINNQYVTDIVTLLYQNDLFNELWKLREKYGLLNEPYPNPRSKWVVDAVHQLDEDIKKLRWEYYIPPNYQEAMIDIVVSGVVSHYKRTYYEYKYEYNRTDPEEDIPGYHIIVLHPSATTEEVVSAYQDFLGKNGIKTKSGKKVGKPRNKSHSNSEPSIESYYHRILSYIDPLPVGRDITSIYEDYRQVKNKGEYISYVLEKVKAKYPEYSDMSINDYKKYQTTVLRNIRSKELSEAEKFLSLFDKEYNTVKDSVKEMGKIISNLHGRFARQAV
jgi:hypothetical protein